MKKLEVVTPIFNSFICNFFTFIGIYAATSANRLPADELVKS